VAIVQHASPFKLTTGKIEYMLSRKTKKKYTEKKKQSNYSKVYLQIIDKWCIKCGVCVDLCPDKVLVLNAYGYPEVRKPIECEACNICVLVCPGFALSLVEKKAKSLLQILGGAA
jgi:2-oxoglutarate ferredoxin oxidoreductase subunit delta